MLRRGWFSLFVLASALLFAVDAAAYRVDCPPGFHGGSPCVPDSQTPPQPAIHAPPPVAYDGPMPSLRSNAIWNAVSATGRLLSPSAGAGDGLRGGALGYDLFTVPETADEIDLVAQAGLAGGYSEKGNRLFDLTLGLGGGYTVGDLTLMALASMAWDGDTGADAPAPRVASGLAVGPALHAQYWLFRSLSLDLSAARLFRITGGADDPAQDVSRETRLSAALGIGESTGASVGASFIDYGIGHAVAATLAVRWGARGR
jgi:hypothetical protein